MTQTEVEKLTDVELRVKVAELAGWSGGADGEWVEPDGTPHQALYPSGSAYGKYVGEGKYDESVPPDYPHDQNAVHEACSTEYDRDPYFAYKYYECLGLVCCGPDSSRDDWEEHPEDLILATARQRAEAFVLAKEERHAL